jgi:CheY-like chemotaxis protein
LLLTLIGGVLDFSKGREGRIQLDLVPGDLRAVASRAVEMLEGRAEQKGIALRFDAESNFPSALIFDPMRVQQVLMNLVGNAVKFTASGSVDVRLRRADASTGGSQVADRCRVSLSVRDTGIGIPARFLPEVFEPFTQADASTARHHGGTGLGLAICKQLVELMGGSIEIESEVGVGTEFRVHLSLEVAPAGVPLHSQMLHATASPALPRASGTPKILVVEDNRVNQEVALGVLARLGCSADVAASGREALEAVVKHAYDLVLLDGERPEMSGIEVARWIRAREREGLLPVYESGALPIVAVTAHALSEYRESCLAAGMNDYLTKPFTIAELASVIERNLPGVLASASDPAGERAN